MPRCGTCRSAAIEIREALHPPQNTVRRGSTKWSSGHLPHFAWFSASGKDKSSSLTANIWGVFQTSKRASLEIFRPHSVSQYFVVISSAVSNPPRPLVRKPWGAPLLMMGTNYYATKMDSRPLRAYGAFSMPDVSVFSLSLERKTLSFCTLIVFVCMHPEVYVDQISKRSKFRFHQYYDNLREKLTSGSTIRGGRYTCMRLLSALACNAGL